MYFFLEMEMKSVCLSSWYFAGVWFNIVSVQSSKHSSRPLRCVGKQFQDPKGGGWGGPEILHSHQQCMSRTGPAATSYLLTVKFFPGDRLTVGRPQRLKDLGVFTPSLRPAAIALPDFSPLLHRRNFHHLPGLLVCLLCDW